MRDARRGTAVPSPEQGCDQTEQEQFTDEELADMDARHPLDVFTDWWED